MVAYSRVKSTFLRRMMSIIIGRFLYYNFANKFEKMRYVGLRMEIEEDDALNLRIYSLKKLNIEISRLFFFLERGKYGVEKFRRFGSILTLLIMGKVLISLKATFIPLLNP